MDELERSGHLKKTKLRRVGKRIMGAALLVSVLFGNAKISRADAVMDEADTSFEPYIAFGADLKADEKSTVMKLLGVEESELGNYKVVEITNQDEHDYLDEYMSADVIGTRALSSVLVVKQEEDHGIGVETHNISYCTSGMYCNALVTAGINDAEVVVAGPFDISGTSALVGAMKAYGVMTGKEISKDTMDTATNELVATGELAEEIGSAEDAEKFIAAIKSRVVEKDLKSAEDISEAVEEIASDMDISISEDQKEKITKLMQKISELDLDIDQLKEQASAVYDKLSELASDSDSFLGKIAAFFKNLFQAIADFFANLFN